jgi:hypothetical protein
MWMGVTYVDPTRKPVIHEGVTAAQAIVMNAGPANVDLLVWSEPGPSTLPPRFRMHLLPGDTRAASGPMIGVVLSEDQRGAAQPAPFAAVGWSIVP